LSILQKEYLSLYFSDVDGFSEIVSSFYPKIFNKFVCCFFVYYFFCYLSLHLSEVDVFLHLVTLSGEIFSGRLHIQLLIFRKEYLFLYISYVDGFWMLLTG